MKVRTRFAPSPTGYMHIGNLRTALYAYLLARHAGGTLILRIEDTDQNRLVDDAVDFIHSTLNAAKIDYDEGPDKGGDYGPYVQTQRLPIYKKYAEELIQKGHAYRCFCSHQDHEGFGGYNRHCRNLTEAEVQAKLAEGVPYVIRQKMPLAGEVLFNDLLHGDITIAADTLEDQILLKSDGMPTYNFANVIDDHLMEITHVLRGTEYITSTPKHVLLYQFLGWTPPIFVHLPVVMGKAADGTVAKLSKRHGATGFSELVEMGYLPEAITNYVALLGWSPKSEEELFTMDELIAKFSTDGLSKSPAVFDYQKLDWFNSEYFKKMPAEDFATQARPFAKELAADLAAKWSYLAALLQPRISKFSDIPSEIAFLAKTTPYTAELFNHKKNKATPDTALEIIPLTVAVLEKVEDWTPEGIDALLKPAIAESGIKMGSFMWPLRIALSGQKVTPGGVTEILYLLGKEESLRRLATGIDVAKGGAGNSAE